MMVRKIDEMKVTLLITRQSGTPVIVVGLADLIDRRPHSELMIQGLYSNLESRLRGIQPGQVGSKPHGHDLVGFGIPGCPAGAFARKQEEATGLSFASSLLMALSPEHGRGTQTYEEGAPIHGPVTLAEDRVLIGRG
tara:strand:+ start:509 stop:919 length:411 start_codon:yes stop_codon:yes gene_type:complete